MTQTAKKQPGRIAKFLLNGSLASLTSLLLRGTGVWFSTYINSAIGAGGVGVYQLVMSVYGLAVTFACSGVGLAATRLVSRETAIAGGSPFGAVKKCISYALSFGSLAAIALVLLAVPIGNVLLKDERTISGLRVLAVSMPFISMSSALNGYFTAVRRITKSAAVQTAEQIIKIASCLVFLSLTDITDLESCCTAIIAGSALSEIASFAILAFLYRRESRRKEQKPSQIKIKAVSSIALPVAVSAYIRSLLHTAKHLIIPIGLEKHGLTRQAALDQFGRIGGMVFPVIMFPSAFLSSFSNLLVPEITEFHTKGDTRRIHSSISSVLSAVTAFSVAIAAFFVLFGGDLGSLLYNDAQTGLYIAMFAPLVISMYADGAVDALLKGLGEQRAVMYINVLDAAVTLLAVWLLLPLYGIKGYIIAFFASELLNFFLSIVHLCRKTGYRLRPLLLLKPLAAAAAAVLLCRAQRSLLPLGPGWLSLCLQSLSCAAAYLLVLTLLQGKEKPPQKQQKGGG